MFTVMEMLGKKIKLFLENLDCKDIDLEKINAY